MDLVRSSITGIAKEKEAIVVAFSRGDSFASGSDRSFYWQPCHPL